HVSHHTLLVALPVLPRVSSFALLWAVGTHSMARGLWFIELQRRHHEEYSILMVPSADRLVHINFGDAQTVWSFRGVGIRQCGELGEVDNHISGFDGVAIFISRIGCLIWSCEGTIGDHDRVVRIRFVGNGNSVCTTRTLVLRNGNF